MLNAGDRVKWNGATAEVTEVFKNGKCRIAYWVQTFGMTKPELWTETVPAHKLTKAAR